MLRMVVYKIVSNVKLWLRKPFKNHNNHKYNLHANGLCAVRLHFRTVALFTWFRVSRFRVPLRENVRGASMRLSRGTRAKLWYCGGLFTPVRALLREKNPPGTEN